MVTLAHVAGVPVHETMLTAAPVLAAAAAVLSVFLARAERRPGRHASVRCWAGASS